MDRLSTSPSSWWARFLAKESSSALLMLAATALAIIMKNSDFTSIYDAIVEYPVQIGMGDMSLRKALILWVNDGLMTLYFLVIGLEMKREFLIGHLQSRRQQVLPLAGALGGMLVPAGIYVLFNMHDLSYLRGWAIPMATDIAFSLGMLSLLFPKVPRELKVFLTALAIFDDLAAIIVIAIYYTPHISMPFLFGAFVCTFVLFICNRMKVLKLSVYLVIGLVMWIMVLKSGVHATVAGVVLAWLIPVRGHAAARGPAVILEDIMHKWVNLIILPVFAFANAGVGVLGLGAGIVTSSVFQGVFWGLWLGKPLGVGVAILIMLGTGLASVPRGGNAYNLAAVACLCGVGFTMSLFIGGLAFEVTATDVFVRAGVLLASLLSIVSAGILLKLGARKAQMACR